MKTKTVYVCEHCSDYFEEPCEKHEKKCLEEKERAAMLAKAAERVEPLCNVLLYEETDDPIGAKINGMMFLVATPFIKKNIKIISHATELVSTAKKPSKRDSFLIEKANEILSS